MVGCLSECRKAEEVRGYVLRGARLIYVNRDPVPQTEDGSELAALRELATTIVHNEGNQADLQLRAQCIAEEIRGAPKWLNT